MPSNSPEAARRLFRAGCPIPGTQAEAYLRARGITGHIDWVALRFHPRVWYRDTEKTPLEAWPALLAAVTDPGGRITGIQRTWLDRGRPDKAPIANPRRALGHLLGNGVRFGDPSRATCSPPGKASRRCSLSNRCCPSLPTIAGALGQPPRRSRSLPCPLRRLYVARDNDAAGRRAAKQLHERGEGAGIDVRDLVPVDTDFNADLCRLGALALLAHLVPQLAP